METFNGTPVALSSKPFASNGVASVAALGPDNKVVLSRKASIDIREFGDVSGSDITSIFDAVYAEAASGGYDKVILPAGTYRARSIAPKSNVAFLAPNGAIICPEADDDEHNALIRNLTDELENLYFEGITFQGNWQAFQSEVADNGLVTLKNVTGVYFNRCKFRNSRFMSINVNQCDSVIVRDCDLQNSVRDFIGVWGTPRVLISGNRLNGNDDDAISVNLESADAAPVRSQIIITNNFLQDCGGIRTQAPKNVLIQGNMGDRQQGYGIAVYVNNASSASISAGVNVKVYDNLITNVIERQWKVSGDQVGSPDARIGIMVRSIPPQAGAYAVVPGTVNPATGTAPNPYDAFFAVADVGGSGAIRVTSGIEVMRNKVGRTLPGATNYSDWGYGQAFTSTGMRNTQVPSSLLSGKGLRVSLPQEDLRIEGNHVSGHRYSLSFRLETGVSAADNLLKRGMVKNNNFIDFEYSGVEWEITGAVYHQDVEIADNNFDGDPYFTNANRGANGTWATAGNAIALNLPYLAGARISRNKVKNVAQPIIQTSVSTLQNLDGNIVIADPAAVGFSISNKGVGNIPAIGGGEKWWLEAQVCDPTSGTFGQSYGMNERNTSSAPSGMTGKWLAGTLVKTRGLNDVGGQTAYGYYRLTTGSGNVDGTDWEQFYVSTKSRLLGTKAYNPGSLALNATETTTVTVTGAALGDFVVGCCFSLDLAGVEFYPYISAANTVTVRAKNIAGTNPIDLASGTLTVIVQKA